MIPLYGQRRSRGVVVRSMSAIAIMLDETPEMVLGKLLGGEGVPRVVHVAPSTHAVVAQLEGVPERLPPVDLDQLRVEQAGTRKPAVELRDREAGVLRVVDERRVPATGQARARTADAELAWRSARAALEAAGAVRRRHLRPP